LSSIRQEARVRVSLALVAAFGDALEGADGYARSIEKRRISGYAD
jgi:hypothetical protein